MADTNFDVDQGSTFSLDVALVDNSNDPIDITTAVVVGEVRRYASSSNVEACFTVTPIDLSLGKFTLTLDAVTTSKLKCTPFNSAQRMLTQFAYDVELHYAGGYVIRILSGVLNVSPEVTR
jgi:hypothetical protein